MRNRVLCHVTRIACAVSVSSLLIIGSIGCDGGAPATGTKSETPPEIKKANNAMEDFEKSKAAK